MSDKGSWSRTTPNSRGTTRYFLYYRECICITRVSILSYSSYPPGRLYVLIGFIFSLAPKRVSLDARWIEKIRDCIYQPISLLSHGVSWGLEPTYTFTCAQSSWTSDFTESERTSKGIGWIVSVYSLTSRRDKYPLDLIAITTWLTCIV